MSGWGRLQLWEYRVEHHAGTHWGRGGIAKANTVSTFRNCSRSLPFSSYNYSHPRRQNPWSFVNKFSLTEKSGYGDATNHDIVYIEYDINKAKQIQQAPRKIYL